MNFGLFKQVLGCAAAVRRRIEHAAILERTVLTVSACPSLNVTLRILSIQEGWHVLYAPTIEVASHILQQHRIHVLLYDRDLPGIEWHRAWRQLEHAEPICFILMSAAVDRRLRESVIYYGGYDAVAKSIDGKCLARAVGSAFALNDDMSMAAGF